MKIHLFYCNWWDITFIQLRRDISPWPREDTAVQIKHYTTCWFLMRENRILHFGRELEAVYSHFMYLGQVGSQKVKYKCIQDGFKMDWNLFAKTIFTGDPNVWGTYWYRYFRVNDCLYQRLSCLDFGLVGVDLGLNIWLFDLELSTVLSPLGTWYGPFLTCCGTFRSSLRMGLVLTWSWLGT